MGLHIALLAAAARGHRRRHGNARRVRRLRPIRQSHKIELKYKYQLFQLVKHCRSVVEGALAELKPHWPRPATDSISQDARSHGSLHDVDQVFRAARAKLSNVDAFAKRVTRDTVAANRESVDDRLAAEIKRAIGVDVSGLLHANGPILQAMREATEANVELIKSIPAQYLDRVYETVTDAWTSGDRWESMVERIQEDGDITERRAKLIARDQTSKMNSAFNQERQQQVGIEKFEWSTSQDERVRESHADLDGQTFEWAKPPIVDGEPATPGSPVCCRCSAIPVIDMEELAIGLEPETEAA